MQTLSGGMSLSLLLLPQLGKDVLWYKGKASLSASLCGGPAHEPSFPADAYLLVRRQDLSLFPPQLFPVERALLLLRQLCRSVPLVPPASCRRRQVRAKRNRATEGRSRYVLGHLWWD